MNRQYLICLLLALTFRLHAQVPAWRISPEWDQVEYMGHDLLRIQKNGKWGVYGLEGKFSISCEYAHVTDIHDGYFLLLGEKNQLLYCYSTTGHVSKINKELYVSSDNAHFSDGLLAVCDNKGKWGYINANGNSKIKNNYLYAFPFFHGVAAVQLKNKLWCYINKSDNAVDLRSNDRLFVKSGFKFASSFTTIDGAPRAVVRSDDDLYMIDYSGKRVENDFITKDGVRFVDGRIDFNKPYHCDGLIIEFDNQGQIAKLENGSKTFVITSGSPAIAWPRVTGFEISYDNQITVSGKTFTSQLQSVIPLNSSTLLVKKDNKWGILMFERDQETISILDKTDVENYHNGNDMSFELSHAWTGVKVYALSDDGRHEIGIANNKFNVPVGYASNSNQKKLILQLEKDGIAFEPMSFDIPQVRKEIKVREPKVDISPTTTPTTFTCSAAPGGVAILTRGSNNTYRGQATIKVSSSSPCSVSCKGVTKDCRGSIFISVPITHDFGIKDNDIKTVNVTFTPKSGGKPKTIPVTIRVTKKKNISRN